MWVVTVSLYSCEPCSFSTFLYVEDRELEENRTVFPDAEQLGG